MMVLGPGKKGLEQIQLKVIKRLGIHFDNCLSLTPHVNHLSKKITSTVCMIRRITGFYYGSTELNPSLKWQPGQLLLSHLMQCRYR